MNIWKTKCKLINIMYIHCTMIFFICALITQQLYDDVANVIKSPWSGVTLRFQFVFCHLHHHCCNCFCFSCQNWYPYMFNFICLGQRKYRSGEMYWMTFLWPWPKITAVALINKNLLVCMVKWEIFIQSLQQLVVVSPSYSHHMVNFRGILLDTFLLEIF